MFYKKILAAVVLAASTLAPAASFAGQAEGAPCILASHHVSSVQPYKVQQRVGRGVTTHLAGAQLFVQAEPGLTAEWLELELTRHIASMRATPGMKDCALDVDDVRVKVDSAGPGFSVKIIAEDPRHAEEVLRRARLVRM
jgi:hypothetical protein